MNAGVVYLVGAGPWNPGLLTLRGRELIALADTIVHDYLVNPALLEHARDDAELIAVGGGRDRRMTQGQINDLLVERGLDGEVVVRLKGGDPFVFGRGGEEATALSAAKVPFEVVPGVTAAIATAAFAGIPVTHRAFGPTLGLCTGHRADEPQGAIDWRALAGLTTVVFYMGARRLPNISANLIEAGRDPATPVALVRWASRPDQQTVVTTLAEAPEAMEAAGLEPPLVVLVGEVVGLRDQIGWFEHKPLHGVRVVVTRSPKQQGRLAGHLAELGAEVVPLPTIDFTGPREPARVAEAVAGLARYDWVLFTSANGVDAFLDALYAEGRDLRAFGGGAKVACVGPATARRLRARGLVPDLVPTEYVAEGLLAALRAEGIAGRQILLPRAEVARETLPDTLRAEGASVDVVPVYRTVAPAVDPGCRGRVARGEVDVITFTASSTVTQFVQQLEPDELRRVQARAVAACIGPITARTAREAGFDVAIEAKRYTVPGLVEALVEWWHGDTKSSSI